MTTNATTSPEQERAEQFLLSRGSAELPHPGGTLYEHLRRVAARLEDWGAPPAVQIAGLCHASYGTDGFSPTLLDLSERATLVKWIGARAESLVYLYCSCDRAAVYPSLIGRASVPFRDRFTGLTHTPSDEDLHAFVEITAANELDVVGHNAELAVVYGATLFRLFSEIRAWLSPAAWADCMNVLALCAVGRVDH